MKIGIISDSHDDVDNVNRAIDIFEQNNVDRFLSKKLILAVFLLFGELK